MIGRLLAIAVFVLTGPTALAMRAQPTETPQPAPPPSTGPAPAAQAPPAGPAPAAQPGQFPTTDPLLLKGPETREDVAPRRALAQARLALLRPLVESAAPPTDELGTTLLQWRTNLIREWEAYVTQLDALAALQDHLSKLSSPEYLAELTARMEELRQEQAALEAQAADQPVTDGQFEQLSAELRQWESELAALGEQQAQRTAELTVGLRQEREAREAELTDLREQRQKFQVPMSDGTSAAAGEMERRDLQRRLLDVQIARTELVLKGVPLRYQANRLEATHAEQYVAALRTYVAALQERLATLTEARRTKTLQDIAAQQARATTVHDQAFLKLQGFRERVLLKYFKNQALLTALQQRFSSAALDRVRDRIALSTATWDELSASLEQRTGQEAMELRARAREERRAYETERVQVQAKLTETVSELYDLQVLREKVLRHFRSLAQELTTALEGANPAEHTRLETEATTLRSGLYQAMAETIRDARDLVARLKESLKLHNEYVAKLRQVEQEAYWSAVQRRESGLAGLDFPAIRLEVSQLLGLHVLRSPTAADAGTLEDEFDELLGIRPNVRHQLARKLDAFAGDFVQVGRESWGVLGIVLFILAVAAEWLRRYARRRTLRLASGFRHSPTNAAGEDEHRLSERLNLLGWRLTQGASLPLAVGAGAWVLVEVLDLGDAARSLILTGVGFLVAGVIVLILVHHVFATEEPEQRVLPCSETVARHYRRWLAALLIFALVVGALPLCLYALDVAPAVRGALLEVFKTGLLLMLLGFLLRRERALGVVGSRYQHWVSTLAAALYPVVFIGVLVLLVLQIVGYGVLVEFIGTGLLASIVLLVLAGVLVEYVCDLLERAARLPEARRAGVEASGPTAVDEPGGGVVVHAVRLGKLVLRLMGVLVTGVLILRVWGVGVLGYQIAWRQIGLAALVVVIGLIVDRAVYAALYTLRTAERIPASTESILRRWLRGLLVVVVGLVLIALAGFDIVGIWALLAGLIAMVAIGFFAVWSVLCNITATLVILIWRPFNVGERIQIQPEGIAGEVVDINFMFTLLKNDDGERVTVPNSLFVQKFVQRRHLPGRPTVTLAQQLEADKPVDEK
ncbi:MAG TPA: mechanosensitive ion channel [Phycisphaerae bacterium]|nr:mechanosensitive ion channel [Phycisphaerae bacterium]HNU45495.1 mechanosensitive ion channel [Phycisphaerae bacterium]